MPAECCTITKVTKIKVEENGKSAVFLNPKKVAFKKIQVDGCLAINATSCDWFICRLETDGILVELKGTDVAHAIEQIEATFLILKKANLLATNNAALIVCSRPPRHPSFTAKLQKARSRLSRGYKAPLHIVSGNYEYSVDKVISQLGPH